ncbi:hypothetical protein LTR91_025153 [Friedmanniomyces endolithicus]|uniref:Chromate ion transporter n=1 Tax=Friedmanniomyces endolithicus TaxID=329885 RepID=A0AAN6JW91_9PEZI|nr:hypothetical protein LTR57_004469 [Friedmanniomyces endolithicus]KAK0951186.1 hypothetical protein LTR91_025153 [Friedmanniomyces endolithicus]KAK0955980.1 hypothetical protein LTS01_023073 [Friedmanniomyces endolithicus]KAK1028709.1 hypothetical protein LTS16_020368 [Friedmanniomyces endolithicus]
MSSALARGVWDALNTRLQLSKAAEIVRPVLAANWHLGFTAFGGPSVHFQIFRKRFVEDKHWIDDQIVCLPARHQSCASTRPTAAKTPPLPKQYQELFAICQATPGPGSTKMLFSINALHSGWLAGILAFLIWSVPGALRMYGLSLGVARIDQLLPGPVYALLTGLNAATVGIIALAAVQLGEKAVTDRLTRGVVLVGGCAGLLYTALWYFPVLMAGAGLATLGWDFRVLQRSGELVRKALWRRSGLEPEALQGGQEVDVELQIVSGNQQPALQVKEGSTSNVLEREDEPRVVPASLQLDLSSWQTSLALITLALALLVAILVLRSQLPNPPRGLSIFANLYLAGTIIFGGGPVVIPLLRTYIVAEGWVSSRDFLIGLAVIQAIPGPNFNFAVYLGSLAALGTPLPSAVGALLAYLGIFAPGILISAGLMGVWGRLRSQRWLKSFLRGVNALAVGLVFTAVYRLWQLGFIDAQHSVGQPLGSDPWWVVVTATSFVTGRWFGLNAAAAILLGGVMGLVWYGIVKG